jgi:hypothetical protein
MFIYFFKEFYIDIYIYLSIYIFIYICIILKESYFFIDIFVYVENTDTCDNVCRDLQNWRYCYYQ